METAYAGLNAEAEWWKKIIIYQVYPRSFQDSNGDGVGDLRGIITRLDHFMYLNVGTIWLNPFYKSPMADFGYDVEDFFDVDPVFGILSDFDDLIAEAHKRGIRVVIDFVPGYTSDQHFWFQESRKGGKDNPYLDYYIWDDGKLLPNGTRVPPNNWLSAFSGPAWKWDSLRKQFFFHQYAPQQVDLNYRNPRVRQEMKQVLRFWLDRGVDGFRVDAISKLFEVEDRTLDEPRTFQTNMLPHHYHYLKHIYTANQPEIHEVMREWKEVIDEHDRQTGKDTFMVVEIYDWTFVESIKYYHTGADMPFNFNLVAVNKTCYGTCIKSLINSWLSRVPGGKWPNFVLGSHDSKRVTFRKGLQYADAMNVLLLTLPGTPTTYYGEEIAMNNIEIDYEDVQDPKGKNAGPELYKRYGRDPGRSPMQWSEDVNAGFSSALQTWLPVHPDYKVRNVEAQKQQGLHSHLEIYRLVAKLRQKRAFQSSDIHFLETNSNLVSFIRYNSEKPGSIYLITLNVGKRPTTDNHEVTILHTTFRRGTVILNTDGKQLDGKEVALNEITLKSGQALIIKVTDPIKVEL